MPRRSFAVAAALLVCACGRGQQSPLELADSRIDALFSVPAGVQCIQLVAAGAKASVERFFGVTPGQSTFSFTLIGIPTGRVVFSGQAFAETCGTISGALPTWIADDVTTTVSAGVPASVQLNFHAKGNANVSGNFGGDEYTVTTLAGVAGSTGSVDGFGAGARLEGPNGIALVGNFLYFIDRTQTDTVIGMTVRRLDVTTNQVITLAGNPGEVGAVDGDGLAARFGVLAGMAYSGGDLYLIDRCALRAMSTTPPYLVRTLIGTPDAAHTSFLCGPPSPFTNNLLDVAVRPNGIYVLDGSHAAVYRVDPGTLAVSLVAGTPDVSGTDDGTVLGATFSNPTGIVFPFRGDDIFCVADNVTDPTTLNRYGLIRRVSLPEDSVRAVAGGAEADFVDLDGLGLTARFAQPRRMVSDGNGLFIGDALAVRRLDLAIGTVVTIAGNDTTAGSADGVGTAAGFRGAFGIARDAGTGKLYVADQGNATIRLLTP